MNILSVWRMWRLYEEVKDMDRKAFINLALSAFAAFVGGFALAYPVSNDVKASASAGFAAALAGIVNQLRQSPIAKP